MHRPARAVALLALFGCTLVVVGVSQSPAVYAATGERCTIVGTAGPDRLVGTDGRDVICGRGGADDLIGRGGADVLDAGKGADELVGGSGADTLLGGGDNDDLVGGRGPDDLVGGPGTNWCTVGGSDSETGCKHDLAAPSADSPRMDHDRVDVTNGDADVDVRVHVVDDTGASRVLVNLGSTDGSGSAIGPEARLVSGTIRDGWWKTTLTVPRWAAPGDYATSVSVRDRVGRWSGREFPGTTLDVVDRNPDLDNPQVILRGPSTTTKVDVRTAAQDVTIEVRATDAVSGVWYLDLCLSKPLEGFYTNLPCVGGDLVSGDRHDGVWRADVRIPRGATGGDWNVSVDAIDRAHRGQSPDQWMGPDLYRSWTNNGQSTDPSVHEFPADRGRFSVIGRRDSMAPRITASKLAPDTVDTVSAPATVKVTVDAADAVDEGVTSVGVALHAASSDASEPSFATLDLDLVAGDATNGTWTGNITLPQGTPPGQYYLQAWVEDITHWRSYVSKDSPYMADGGQQELPGNPVLTVVD